MNILGILVLFACGTLGSAQAFNNTTSVLCYQCSPLVYGASNCADPARFNLPPVNCSSNAPGIIPSCYSSFLNYNNVTGNGIYRGNETGIYRGCANFNHCLQYPGTNVTVMSCRTCAFSRCNTHTFNSGGGIIGGGGGATTTFPSFILILFCGIFMFCKLFLKVY